MHRKRNIVIFGLLGVIIIVCVLQRTNIFSTAFAPTLTDFDSAAVEEIQPIVSQETEESTEPAVITEPKPLTPKPTKRCYVTGCSSQLCSSEEEMMSTCEYREEYACFKAAKCEVQSDGECGWTQSEDLNSCLMNGDIESRATVEIAI